MRSYFKYAIDDAPQRWRWEGFMEHYNQIVVDGVYNMYHFQKMMALYQSAWFSYLYQAAQILLQSHLTIPHAKRVCDFLMKIADEDDKDTYTDQQRTDTCVLAQQFIEEYHLTGNVVLLCRWHCVRVLGPQNTEEALEFFQKENGFPTFRTEVAKEKYQQYLPAEVLTVAAQTYYDQILHRETYHPHDHETLCKLLLEYPIWNKDNVLHLHEYFVHHVSVIPMKEWPNVLWWIAFRILPRLKHEGERELFHQFMHFAESVVLKTHTLKDCSGCGESEKDAILAQLVQLETHHKP